jgi:hypothetical protein
VCSDVKESNTVKTLRRIALLPVVLVVLALVALGALVVLDRFADLSILGSDRDSRNSEVINAVTREEQVVLLSLSIQGIDIEKDKADAFGIDIPGSGRTSFLQYGFDAKLGLEGGGVTIEKSGDTSYLVTVPEFTFIGHDNVDFQTVAEDNGVLSFSTPDLDTAEVITEILNDETRSQYVANNDELLRDQTESFYEGIITGVDPTVDVEFAFED